MSNAKPRGSRTAGGLRHEETPDLRRGPCSHPVSDQHYRPKDGADAKDREDPHNASPHLLLPILVDPHLRVKGLSGFSGIEGEIHHQIARRGGSPVGSALSCLVHHTSLGVDQVVDLLVDGADRQHVGGCDRTLLSDAV